jgi:hypothetical protein
MIWIDLEHKLPTDKDILNWAPWPQAQWDAWLAKSTQLVNELAQLDVAGKRDERNAHIDANKAHWDAIKPWLLALSGGKCWFTEARDIASHLDVEHFRPKKLARNVNGTVRDGYWWLAFNYMNLRIAGTVPNRKKGSWFPLQPGSPFSTYKKQCESSESNYFLDPTNKHDVSLLAFDDEGNAVPVPQLGRWDRIRVLRTVQRLKLTEHQALAEERRKVWQRMKRTIDLYLDAKAKATGPHAAAERQKMYERAREIHEMTSRTALLSAVARWHVILRDDKHLLNLIA